MSSGCARPQSDSLHGLVCLDAHDRVLGLPIELTAVEEGSAYGAALLAGVQAGVFADAHEAVATCVRVAGSVEPDPGWQEAYEEGHRRYRALYPALKTAIRGGR